MTRHLLPVILICGLAVPAFAQHSRGADTPSSGTAVPSAPAPAPSSSSSSSGGSSNSGGSSSGPSSTGSTSSSPGHRRGDISSNGTATARGGRTGSGGTIVIGEGSGFYPWGYYDGAIAFGGFFDGYYGAYDPWYGWFPTYAAGGSYGERDVPTGSVRLKVKPNDAAVYVDGFYAGVVDDFDNGFQRLKLEPGPHHIEIREQNYEPLSVDVMIQEDFTITYRGELAKQ